MNKYIMIGLLLLVPFGANAASVDIEKINFETLDNASQKAVFYSKYLKTNFYFLGSTTSENCGSAGCSLEVFKGESQEKTINVITYIGEIYAKDCPNSFSIILNGKKGYSEWLYLNENFKIQKTVKTLSELTSCSIKN